MAKVKSGDADHGRELLISVFHSADRSLLQKYLARVGQRIRESEKIISRQKAVIAQQEGARLDATTSRVLVAQFEQLLELQLEDRERLRHALDQAATTPDAVDSNDR